MKVRSLAMGMILASFGESGNRMLVIELHSANMSSPIDVSDFGMDTLVSDVQYANAKLPIYVTDSGIVMLVSALHPKKAPFLI